MKNLLEEIKKISERVFLEVEKSDLKETQEESKIYERIRKETGPITAKRFSGWSPDSVRTEGE